MSYLKDLYKEAEKLNKQLDNLYSRINEFQNGEFDQAERGILARLKSIEWKIIHEEEQLDNEIIE